MSRNIKKVVFLNQKSGKYDLSKLPKRSRKSSSFNRARSGGASLESEAEEEDVEDQTNNFDSVQHQPETTSRVVPNSCTILYQPQTLEAYTLELITARGIFIIDSKTAVINDYDPNQGVILKENKFHLVERQWKCFANGSHWVYCCSCNPRGHELVCSLVGKISKTYEEFETTFTQCIHGGAMKYFMEQFESCNDILFTNNATQELGDHDYVTSCSIYELPSTNDVVCVNAGKRNFGFVGINKNKLCCLSCQNGGLGCQHIQHINNSIQSPNPNIPDVVYTLAAKINGPPSQTQSVSGSGPFCFSKEPIQFVVPQQLQIIFNTGLYSATVVNIHTGEHGMVPTVISIGQHCPVCSSPWSMQDPVEMNWSHKSVMLFTMATMFRCKVYHRKCSNTECSQVLHLDGGEFGVLYIGSRMFSHEVLRDYMNLFLHSGITLHTFFNVWEQRNFDAGNINFRQYIDYNSWRFAWFGFLRLLDINYKEGWLCPLCGQEPNVVICDATSLAFQKQFVRTPKIVSSTEQDAVVPSPISHSQRVMIPVKEARELLQMFIKNDTNLSQEKMLRLKYLLDIHCPSLSGVLKWMNDHELEATHPHIISLLSALNCNTPVCAIVHPDEELLGVLHELCTAAGAGVSADSSKMLILQMQCPLIFRVICTFQSDIPEPWKVLFKDLVEKATLPFGGSPIPFQACDVQDGENGPLAYFPNLPLRRKRATFAQDLRTDKERGCTKNSGRHPSLLPGIFTMFCQHGICYGFEVMECHESPNVPFSIIWTRFEKAPGAFVYDNACNFHKYCLNRDPVFFKRCWCLVDRFHWKNHTGCSIGYKMSTYPGLDQINSQINEQRNATLKKLRSSLSYMNEENFMNHVKLFLWNLNRLSLQNINS